MAEAEKVKPSEKEVELDTDDVKAQDVEVREPEKKEETKDKISWLFVQTAETAEVTSEDTLVMPVTREIFAFTDRPNRLHGYLNAHEFVAFWDEGGTFKADPPNAVLTWVDADKKVHEAEVILTGAEVRMQGRAIAYAVG